MTITEAPYVRDATVGQPVATTRSEPLIPVSWQLKWLLDIVGERVIGAATGVASAHTVREWAAEELTCSVEVEERLGLLFQTAFIIEFRYDAETAVSFLVSSNEYLDDESPLALINSEVHEVVEPRLRTAVKVFIDR